MLLATVVYPAADPSAGLRGPYLGKGRDTIHLIHRGAKRARAPRKGLHDQLFSVEEEKKCSLPLTFSFKGLPNPLPCEGLITKAIRSSVRFEDYGRFSEAN